MSEAHQRLTRYAAQKWGPLALEPARTALVVVDMQRYFIRADSAFCQFLNHQEAGYTDWLLGRVEETVAPNLRKLVAAHHQAGSPVFWTQLASRREDGSDLALSHRTLNEKATAAGFEKPVPWIEDYWAGIPEELGVAADDGLVNKTTYGTFASTDFEQTLRARGVETVVMCGVVTNVCVETSAREAVDRGFLTIVVEDACSAFSPEVQAGNLFAFQANFGKVVTTEAVVEALGG